MRTFVAPLLREGSTLVEAHARLRRDPATNWWIIVIEPADNVSSANGGWRTHEAPHEMTLLPCTRLTEMERIIEATHGGDARFRVNGRVYVFRDRNYFLPTHAAVISEPAGEPTSHPASAPTSIPATAPNADAGATTPPSSAPVDDDSPEAIARALAQETGPLARSSGSARARPTETPATRAAIDRSAIGTTPGDPDSLRAADRTLAMQENAVVVNRRGKVMRDRTGGWLLVFDADSSGLADPPMRLMPCRLLESIEDYARRVGNNSPVIITGQILLYNGQTHLLPTVFRIPKERSRLSS